MSPFKPKYIHGRAFQVVLSRSVMSDSLWPIDCSSSVHGILQERILEWVAMPSSRGSSQPRDRTQVSHIAGRFSTIWATREALPGGKEPACQEGRHKRLGFDPRVRKIPWRKACQTTPVFLPGKFHGQRSLMSWSP